MKKKWDIIQSAKILCGAMVSMIFFILGFLLSNFINHFSPVVVSLVLIMILGIYIKKLKDVNFGSGILIGFLIILVFIIFILGVAKGMH